MATENGSYITWYKNEFKIEKMTKRKNKGQKMNRRTARTGRDTDILFSVPGTKVVRILQNNAQSRSFLSLSAQYRLQQKQLTKQVLISTCTVLYNKKGVVGSWSSSVDLNRSYTVPVCQYSYNVLPQCIVACKGTEMRVDSGGNRRSHCKKRAPVQTPWRSTCLIQSTHPPQPSYTVRRLPVRASIIWQVGGWVHIQITAQFAQVVSLLTAWNAWNNILGDPHK